jgi:hypothetical protein
MMPDRSKYWCHGVDVHVQFTREYGSTGFAGETDAGEPTAIVRNSSGTTIRQDGDGNGGRTSNWFHFAVPTPTQLIDNDVDVRYVYLTGRINGQATVVAAHVWMGGTPAKQRVYQADDLSLSARALNERYSAGGTKVTAPLVLCVKVLFEDGGEVIFAGAGAQFVGPEVSG